MNNWKRYKCLSSLLTFASSVLLRSLSSLVVISMFLYWLLHLLIMFCSLTLPAPPKKAPFWTAILSRNYVHASIQLIIKNYIYYIHPVLFPLYLLFKSIHVFIFLQVSTVLKNFNPQSWPRSSLFWNHFAFDSRNCLIFTSSSMIISIPRFLKTSLASPSKSSCWLVFPTWHCCLGTSAVPLPLLFIVSSVMSVPLVPWL